MSKSISTQNDKLVSTRRLTRSSENASGIEIEKPKRERKRKRGEREIELESGEATVRWERE